MGPFPPSLRSGGPFPFQGASDRGPTPLQVGTLKPRSGYIYNQRLIMQNLTLTPNL